MAHPIEQVLAALNAQTGMGLRMTPAERLRWLEETMEALRRWQGRARQGKPIRSPRG